MNENVLRGMPGEEHVLFSADSIAPGDDSAANYPIEFLNSLNLSARDQAQGRALEMVERLKKDFLEVA